MDIFTKLDESKLNNTETTPSQLTANQAASNMSPNAATDKGVCPLQADVLYLLPVRYGLVETLKPAAIKQNFKTRPTALRLIRNGWLYIFDKKDKLFYEYRTESGYLQALTFKGTKLQEGNVLDSTGDTVRNIPIAVDGSQFLKFDKNGRTIQVCYSEAQWSVEKCNLIIDDETQRNHSMQSIVLNGVNCAHQNQHTFNAENAEAAIAEFSEPSGKKAYESDLNPFMWTDASELLAMPASFTDQSKAYLRKALPAKAQQQRNYIYIAVDDTLGFCRDLANEQELVFNQLKDHMEQNNNELKFTTANYLDFIQAYNDNNTMTTEGISDYFKKLTPSQRKSVYEYMEVKDRADASLRRTSHVPQKIIQEFQEKSVAFEQVAKQNRQQLDNDMALLRKQQKGVNLGVGLGSRGLKDLTNFYGMQDYLRETKQKIADWNRRLDKISEDRLSLICSGEFFKAMWVFDGKAQRAQALITEATCVRDLLRGDEHKTKLKTYLDANPQFMATAFYTNPFKLIKDAGDKLLDLWNSGYNILYEDSKTINTNKNRVALIKKVFDTENSIYVFDKELSSELAAVKYLSNKVYLSAILNNQFKALAELPDNLATVEASFTRYLKNTGPAGSTFILNTLAGNDLEATTTNPEGLKQIKTLLDQATQLSIRNKLITSRLIIVEKKLAVAATPQEELGAKQQKQALLATQQTLLFELQSINSDIAKLLVPAGEPGAVVGIRITGLSEEQLKLYGYEATMLNKGVFKNYGIKADLKSTLFSNALPILIFAFQSYTFYTTLKSFFNDYQKTKADVLFSGIGGLAAGLTVWQSYLTGKLSSVLDAVDDKAYQLAQQASKYTATAAGSATAIKIGNINLFLGGASNFFASLAGGYALYSNYDRWFAAMASDNAGESLSAGAAMVGTMGTTGITSYNAVLAGRGVMEGIIAAQKLRAAGAATAEISAARAAIWAERGLQAGAKAAALNPATWVLTALAVFGETGYNYWHLDEQQKWCQQGIWGNNNALWDETTSNKHLAEAVISPALIDKGVDPNDSNQRIIHLLLTGQTTLATAPIELCAIWENNVEAKPLDISYLVKSTGRLLPTEGGGSTTLAFTIPWDNKGVNLQLRLLYTPDLVNEPLFKADNGFFIEANYKQPAANKNPAIGIKATNNKLHLPYHPTTLTVTDLA